MDFAVTNSEQSDARVGTTRFHGYSRVQQMELEKKTPDIVNVRAQLELDSLSSTIHLSEDEKQIARRKVQQHRARRLLKMATKGMSPIAAWRLLRRSRLTVAELASGLAPHK